MSACGCEKKEEIRDRQGLCDLCRENGEIINEIELIVIGIKRTLAGPEPCSEKCENEPEPQGLMDEIRKQNRDLRDLGVLLRSMPL